jgi:hypothetical protein
MSAGRSVKFESVPADCGDDIQRICPSEAILVTLLAFSRNLTRVVPWSSCHAHGTPEHLADAAS